MYRFRCPNVPLAPSNSPKGESLNRMKEGKAAPSNSPKGESLNRMKKGKAFLLPLTSYLSPLTSELYYRPYSAFVTLLELSPLGELEGALDTTR